MLVLEVHFDHLLIYFESVTYGILTRAIHFLAQIKQLVLVSWSFCLVY